MTLGAQTSIGMLNLSGGTLTGGGVTTVTSSHQNRVAAYGAGSTVETDDLSRSIVDTEAALRSKRALRDRLQALLQRPADKVQDLFDVEQQLTQVQTEIDR